MKQTNNAIKFLMAQYRAIFKSAYFKGLATAAVVTMGLAAGAAQANTGYLYSGGWLNYHDTIENMSAGDYILAGQIAGDALSGSSGANLSAEQANNTAADGTLTIGNYVNDGTMNGTGFMGSGTAAANWAEASGNGVTVSAINGTVTVNGSGYVDGSGSRGLIYGGWAKSSSGAAIASGNQVLVQKDANSANKAAAQLGIVGGKANGKTGASATGNVVSVTGSASNLQDITTLASGSYVGGFALASGNSSTGTYEASDNELLLDSVSFSGSVILAEVGGLVNLNNSSG